MAVLDGIRVLDLARYVAGPMSAALLADFGADVIRIEPPGGAEDRMPLPLSPNYHGGAGFVQTGRNKRGMSLDFATVEGRAIFDRLLETADVVVANLPPSAMRSLKLDYEALAAVKPDIIFLHLTAFGSDGPLAERVGFDAIAQVMSGMTYMSGEPGAPTKSAAAWVDMATGFLGAFGVMAALRHRDLSGHGQKVEANLFQTALTVANYFVIEQAMTGIERQPTGNRAPSGAPADLIPTKDGWIYVAVLGNAMFKRFARLIGQEELCADPQFQSDEQRAARGETLSKLASNWSHSMTSDMALAALEHARVPAGALLSHRDILGDTEIRAHYFEDVSIQGLALSVPYARSAIKLSATPACSPSGPPSPGSDTLSLLDDLGYEADEIRKFEQSKLI